MMGVFKRVRRIQARKVSYDPKLFKLLFIEEQKWVHEKNDDENKDGRLPPFPPEQDSQWIIERSQSVCQSEGMYHNHRIEETIPCPSSRD